jgi:small subunit ribosomal protein S1
MLNIGDEVQVVVLSIDVKEQKIALGIRQTMDNPWDTVLERFPVGSKITGKVRNYTAYGAFVELEEGIDGMIHVSDMSWTRKINHPSECLQKGQEVEAVVLEVNAADQRISLGLKQAQNDPWSEIAAKYAVGSTVKGKVSKIASFGAFIELEDGVDGLVHISQISDNRIEKVKDALNVGDEVEARVVKVDRAERRIGLSIRAMTMTESEIKALEAEASGEDAGSESKSSGSDNLGGLSAAFDNAFANFEWQPGETK